MNVSLKHENNIYQVTEKKMHRIIKKKTVKKNFFFFANKTRFKFFIFFCNTSQEAPAYCCNEADAS